MSEELHEQIQAATTAATSSVACAERLYRHMLAILLNQSRATLTNLICLGGTQQRDWSADYRLYSKDRVDEGTLFGHARDRLLEKLPEGQPLVVGLDDTIVRKTGKKIHGAGWKRDPLSPAFQTNLVFAQRYLQFSAAWPMGDGRARMIPIDLQHAPSPAKPKKNAKDPQGELDAYREALKQQNLNKVCLDQIGKLRRQVPASRHLIITGDGSFTNKTILRGRPGNTIYIGRGRKDMALHHLPEVKPGKDGVTGRPQRYGAKAPTPEELRQDESIPWQHVRAFAAGGHHDFKIKTLSPVLWRKSGADLALRIVVIAPLGYRLTKGGRMLYRQPAYLVCTDPELALEELLQSYLWRWGIEVNFREEKELIGTGQAQVRTPSSTQHLPAVSAASYALLWTSALSQLGNDELATSLKPPKWRAKPQPSDRLVPSTGELRRILRHEIWAGMLRPGTFYDFVSPTKPDGKCEKPRMNLAAALFSAA